MTTRRARLMALVPVLGLATVIVTTAILTTPGQWLGFWREDIDAAVFGLILVLLLLAPHVALVIILFRGSPGRWLWRSAAVAAVIGTAGQLLVGGIVLTDDDPQTPILLALYAPLQLAAVVMILFAGFLISLISRLRTGDRRDADVRSGR